MLVRLVSCRDAPILVLIVVSGPILAICDVSESFKHVIQVPQLHIINIIIMIKSCQAIHYTSTNFALLITNHKIVVSKVTVWVVIFEGLKFRVISKRL